MPTVDQQSSLSLQAPGRNIWRRTLAGCLTVTGAFALLLTATACDGPGKATEGGTGEEDSDDGVDPNAVPLLDKHNYSSEAELKLNTVETVSGKNLEICWSDLKEDIRCHDTDPVDDIDNIALLRFRNLTKDEIQEKMASGELPQSVVDGYMEKNVEDEECIDLEELNFFGSKAIVVDEDYVESDENVYVLVAATGTTPGVGARVLTFLEPNKKSDNKKVDIEDGCETLDFEADLSSLEKLEIEKDGPWLVDWGDATKDSLGNKLAKQNIDKVLLGYYKDKTAEDLEKSVMDLELIADELYVAELKSGTKIDLTFAVDDKDKSFSSFKDGGTWILAMMCTTCQNPAPLLLTILDPQ